MFASMNLKLPTALIILDVSLPMFHFLVRYFVVYDTFKRSVACARVFNTSSLVSLHGESASSAPQAVMVG